MGRNINCLRACLIVTILACGASTHAATVYTWLGGADTDWENAANWDVAGIPVDEYTDSGDSLSVGLNGDMTIIFAGTTMPTINVPGIGGRHSGSKAPNTPILDLRSGGALGVDYVGLNESVVLNGTPTATVLTVGDGIGGPDEDVVLDVTGRIDLARHPGNIFNTAQVNSDGTLLVGTDLLLSYYPNRHGTLDVAGGVVEVGHNLEVIDSPDYALTTQTTVKLSGGGRMTVDGYIDNMLDTGATVDLLDPFSTFTAGFGGEFLDLSAVEAAIGSEFISSTGWSVRATDNLDGSFTLTAVPEPSTGALLTVLAAAVVGLPRRRRRR